MMNIPLFFLLTVNSTSGETNGSKVSIYVWTTLDLAIFNLKQHGGDVSPLHSGGPTSLKIRGGRYSQTRILIGQLSSSCPIRARELYLLSNQSMRL